MNPYREAAGILHEVGLSVILENRAAWGFVHNAQLYCSQMAEILEEEDFNRQFRPTSRWKRLLGWWA